MIYDTNKLNKATNEMVLTLQLCQLLFARGCYKAKYFLCIITVLITLYSSLNFFYFKTMY